MRTTKSKDTCHCGQNCNCNSSNPDTSSEKAARGKATKRSSCRNATTPISNKNCSCGVTSNQPYSNICDVNRPFNNQYAPTGMEKTGQNE